MISPDFFYNSLKKVGINFIAGVPDSLLKEFCKYADICLPKEKHVITTSEGAAVSLATGVYLATGDISLVYLQNSGLGNAVNPLLSLADPEVYGVPMVLMVGWRGNPNIKNFKDEPQHVKQGRVTPGMLEAMEVPYQILSLDPVKAKEQAEWASSEAKNIGGPVVILVTKDTFSKSDLDQKEEQKNIEVNLTREEVIKYITSNIPKNSFIISSTGMISRELYESRENFNQEHTQDFLTVGSMGFASQIALGISLSKPEKDIICLDGDGAALMHLGGMASIGTSDAKKYKHILLNNGVHDSVGGQPTLGFNISFTKIAEACGYKKIIGPIFTLDNIKNGIEKMFNSEGPSFMEIRIIPGARKNLGRPRESPKQNKELFINCLRK